MSAFPHMNFRSWGRRGLARSREGRLSRRARRSV